MVRYEDCFLLLRSATKQTRPERDAGYGDSWFSPGGTEA